MPGLTAIDFQRRIRENGNKILDVYRATNDAQAKGETITPAAQWLLDNHYLIEETVFQVKRDLPRRFYRELPVASFGGGQPMPRALAIAWAYVAHSDSSVSASMFEAIVEGYQSVEPLKIGELWALPSLLALRADREPAPAGAARQPHARDAQRRQHAGRPYRRRGRRRRPGGPARALRGACARHHLHDAAAAPAARRLAQRRPCAGLARDRARKPRHQRRGDDHRRAPDAVGRQRHDRQHRARPEADQRRRLDGLVREGQPGRRAAARAGAVCRSRFPLARPLPRRDRGTGARLGAHRTCRRRACGRQGQGGGRRRSRHVGHRLLPGRRTSRRAGSGDRLPRAVRSPASGAPIARPAGPASSARPPRSPRSCCR